MSSSATLAQAINLGLRDGYDEQALGVRVWGLGVKVQGLGLFVSCYVGFRVKGIRVM